jgi:isopentenyl phosphate kinase
MRERVVIKWGGGLITKKDVLKQPHLEIIGSLADQILECNLLGIDVILVHGAGSFGHLKAKKYRPRQMDDSIYLMHASWGR